MNTCISCGSEPISLNDWHWRCPVCGLYISNLEAGSGTGIDGLEQLRKENFELLLDGVSEVREVNGLNILEVGCSQGFFLEAAASRGASIVGIEPETTMADLAKDKGFEVYAGFFPDAVPDGSKYDLVIFNDVFEHLPFPLEAARTCADILKSDGLLVINLPSSKGIFFQIARSMWKLGASGPYERLWQKEMPSPHMHYFSPENLRLLVEKVAGFRQIKTHNLPSIERSGTRQRVAASYGGLLGTAIAAGVNGMSSTLPYLPADIHVAYFKKD